MLSKSTSIIIIGAGIALFWLNFWGWDLWAPDEPRYAQVAHEMLQGKQWVVPHLGGEVYTQKPPLFFWLIASSYSIFGINSFAVRLIPVLSVTGSILLTYLLGKRLFGERGGVCSAMVLATSIIVMHLGRRGNIDVTLMLMVTGSLALIARASLDNKSKLYLPAYLLMALGVLLKGPVAFLLPLLVMIFYLIAIGDAAKIGRTRIWLALIILVAIVGAWLIPATLTAGSQYFKTIVFKQNIGRAISSFSHKKPFYYYLLQFPHMFFPWIVFFPQAAYYLLRNKTRENLFPLVWFAVVFVFFSLISGKRGLYILPLFPAAALITGPFLADIIDGKISRKTITIAGHLLAGILAATAAGIWFIKIPDYANALANLRWPVSIMIGLAAAIMVLQIKRNRQHQIPTIVYTLMIVLSVHGTFFIFPAVNSFKTARFLCEDLLELRKNDEDVILYRDNSHSGAYHFYTRLELIALYQEDELKSELKRNGDIFIISSKKNYDKLTPATKENWRHVKTRRVGHRTMMLFKRGKGSNGP
jgi:4-amino-4-deoxy-L-arabinose transferase-like glycosyltransferase